ncbi:MAG TPA: ribose-phosphate diphosphokinase [Candidatus Nanoarchaeia archaeon]|nr:ribose-phosphate diphosphokinase [Candidatus Nanoarchaeia archaeon]
MKIFVLNSARHLLKGTGRLQSSRFSDGEIYVRIIDDVKDERIILLANTNPPAENLLELILALDALRRQNAKVHLIIPYISYARQDRASIEGEAVSAEAMSRMLRQYNPASITVIDAHSGRLKKFLDFNDVSALRLLLSRLRVSERKNMVIAAPDKGAVERAKKASEMLKCSVVLLEKHRPGHDLAKIRAAHGDVKRKNVLIIDDMIDTGGTVIAAAEFLKKAGARDIIVAATHAVLSGDAVKRLDASKIKKVLVTDSLKCNPGRRFRIVKLDKSIREIIGGINGR